MGGGVICYVTRCTQNLTVEEFWVGLGISVLVVAGIVLLIRFLQGPQ